MWTHKKIQSIALLVFSIQSLFAQDTIVLKNNHRITEFDVKYKSDERLYFLHKNQIVFIERQEFKTAKEFWWIDGEKTVLEVNWNNLKAKSVGYNEYYLRNKKYAGQSSAGIVFTLIMPSVLSVVAIETGITELAYASLGFSVIGIGLWLSSIKNLRVANELAHATHYTGK